MTNGWITWVLLAPGFASCCCFLTEDFVEGMQAIWEYLDRYLVRCWWRNRDRKHRSEVPTGQSE